MKLQSQKNHNCKSKGSALILTMVLTVLLAAIGVTFLMLARVDEAVTSNLSQEKELKAAVDSIIGTISNELVLDTPGVAAQEYYDYPGDKDTWLAAIEPYAEAYEADETNTYWAQITDLTGYIKREFGPMAANNMSVDPPGISKIIKEYPEIIRDSMTGEYKYRAGAGFGKFTDGQPADADGDGIADSKWIELDEIKTGKGKPIYAAIRVIDNCGMVNVNTAIACDPEAKYSKMNDGSSLTHIDFAGLVGRDNSQGVTEIMEDEVTPSKPASLSYLLKGWNASSDVKISGRLTDSNLETFSAEDSAWWDTEIDNDWWEDIGESDSDALSGIDYIDDYFSWRWGNNANNSMRFGIAEELALRERFCVKRDSISRIESLWPWRDGLGYQQGIYDGTSPSGSGTVANGARLSDWIARLADVRRITDPSVDPKFKDADKRHWLTTYSFDRIIDPDGRKQINLNIDISEDAKRLDQYDFPRPDFNNSADRINRSEMMARALYLTFVKALSKNKDIDADGVNPKEITRSELRKLGQLAVNIVDQRDKDVDITRLSLAMPEYLNSSSFDSVLHDEFKYLYTDATQNKSEFIEGYGWYDDETDLNLENAYDPNFYDPNSVVYGIEPHPVISGVAVHYDAFGISDLDGDGEVGDVDDWTLVDWGNDTTIWDQAYAKYAIELYNPYDFTLNLPVNDDYRLVLWNRVDDQPYRTISLFSEARVVSILPRSFVLVTNDSMYWKGSHFVENAADTVAPSSINFEFTAPVTHTDREAGHTQRTISNYAIRTPGEILLARDVEGVRVYLDRYTIDPTTVHWDVEAADGVTKYEQRLTMPLVTNPPVTHSDPLRNDIDDLDLFERQNRWWDMVNPVPVTYLSYEDGDSTAINFIARERTVLEVPDSVREDRFTRFDPSMVTKRWLETDASLPPANTLHETDYLRGEQDGVGVKDTIEKVTKGYKNRPIAEFTTVGDISRIWTVGPQRWELVHDKMKTVSRDYRLLLDNQFSDDPTPVYDPGEAGSSFSQYMNWNYANHEDPNNWARNGVAPADPNSWEDYAFTPGDYVRVLQYSGHEEYMRIDLRNPRLSNIFQYVTAFDPSRDYIDNDGDGIADPKFDTMPHEWEFKNEDRSEWKIPGRINVNTAPWYVVAQLPWVKVNDSNPNIIPNFDDADQYKLVNAICAYRDKRQVQSFSGSGSSGPDYSAANNARYKVMKSRIIDDSLVGKDDVREERGFASIGEIALVVNSSAEEYSIDKLGRDSKDIKFLPDLVTNVRDDLAVIDPNSTSLAGDNAEDDFEEKDMIFSRLSNLATVRSDTFTAYILVRLGENGPQKRVIAILDRSDVYPEYDDNGKNLSQEAVEDNKPPKTVGRVKIVGYKQIGDVTY